MKVVNCIFVPVFVAPSVAVGAFSISQLINKVDVRLMAHHPDAGISRRSLFNLGGLSSLTCISLLSGMAPPANAVGKGGLVQFPCRPGELRNTYHLMRAGESFLEEEGILSTNPLFLTNRDDALTVLGTAQVEAVRIAFIC